MEQNFVIRLRAKLEEDQTTFGARFRVSQPAVHFWEKNGPPQRGLVSEALADLAAKNGIEIDQEPEPAE